MNTYKEIINKIIFFARDEVISASPVEWIILIEILDNIHDDAVKKKLKKNKKHYILLLKEAKEYIYNPLNLYDSEIKIILKKINEDEHSDLIKFLDYFISLIKNNLEGKMIEYLECNLLNEANIESWVVLLIQMMLYNGYTIKDIFNLGKCENTSDIIKEISVRRTEKKCRVIFLVKNFPYDVLDDICIGSLTISRHILIDEMSKPLEIISEQFMDENNIKMILEINFTKQINTLVKKSIERIEEIFNSLALIENTEFIEFGKNRYMILDEENKLISSGLELSVQEKLNFKSHSDKENTSKLKSINKINESLSRINNHDRSEKIQPALKYYRKGKESNDISSILNYWICLEIIFPNLLKNNYNDLVAIQFHYMLIEYVKYNLSGIRSSSGLDEIFSKLKSIYEVVEKIGAMKKEKNNLFPQIKEMYELFYENRRGKDYLLTGKKMIASNLFYINRLRHLIVHRAITGHYLEKYIINYAQILIDNATYFNLEKYKNIDDISKKININTQKINMLEFNLTNNKKFTIKQYLDEYKPYE